MDSDDELMATLLMEEEADIEAEEEENMAILACLVQLQAEEAANAEPKHGGSNPGRMKTKPRQRMEGHYMLYIDYFIDYFADVPAFTPKDFRWRFRMNMDLFLRIQDRVREHDPWFRLKKDCMGLVGFSSLQKCSATMRMLAYGAPTS